MSVLQTLIALFLHFSGNSPLPSIISDLEQKSITQIAEMEGSPYEMGAVIPGEGIVTNLDFHRYAI